jgi:hypothetical protein
MADIDPTINPSTTASVDAVAAIQSLSSANVSGATDSAVTLEGMSGGMVRGSSGTAINPISKQPVAFDWVAAPVGSLITSNDPVTLAPNEAYNQAYQGRNREAVTSEMLVNDIANNPIFGLLSQSATTDIGAPMFAPNGAVLAGNAREMGLERGASLGTRGAGQYQEQLRVSASQYGINAADLDANIFYTLTRQITSPMDAGQYAQFAAESNIPSTTGMTQLELAQFDASRMQAAGSFGLLHGAVSPTAANTQFFTSFASTLSSSERSTIVNEEGMLSPAGVGRAQRAVQAYAYPDDSILARMMETTDDESAAVSRGLRSAAPDIARLRSSIASGAVAAQYGDILGPLNEAVGVYSGIREQGGTSTDVAAYLANGDLGLGGGISDWGRSLLGVLQTPSQIGPTLKEYARRSMNTADQRNGNLPFDDAPGLATAEALYNSIVPGQLGIADDGSAATVPIRIVDTTGAVSSAAASGVTRVKESRFMSRFRRTVGSGGIDSYEEQYYSQFGAEAPVEGFAPWLQSEYGVGPQMRAPTASEWRARTAGDDQSFVGVLPPVITPYGEGRPVRSGLPALIPAEVPSERVVGADGRLNTPVNNKGARAVLPPDDGAVSRSDATLAGDVAVA